MDFFENPSNEIRSNEIRIRREPLFVEKSFDSDPT